MKFRTIIANMIASLAVLSAAPALAQSAGDTIVSAGWSHITGEGKFFLSSYTIESGDTLSISLTRFLTDNWTVALDMGMPSQHILRSTSIFSPAVDTGTAKRWAPTVSVNYYFRDAQEKFRPFVGLGLARISYNVDSYNAVGINHINDAWAPAANVGATYALNKDWYAGFTLSTMYSSMKITYGNGFVDNSSKTFPVTTYLSVGYRF